MVKFKKIIKIIKKTMDLLQLFYNVFCMTYILRKENVYTYFNGIPSGLKQCLENFPKLEKFI